MDHRKTTPAITASMAQLVPPSPAWLNEYGARTFPAMAGLAGINARHRNRAGKLHSR